MKKLSAMIGIVLAVVLALSLALPAMANGTDETIPTEAEVGGSDSPPYICAKFETPDEDSSKAGVQIVPEPPAPPLPPACPDADGWKIVKFYVVAGDPNGVGDIAAIDVSVYYPTGVPEDGKLKFQLRAIRDSNEASGWRAEGGPTANDPPYDWAPPSWTVRQLKYDATNGWDKVDMNGDCDTDDAEDLAVPDALAALGNLVKYGKNPNTGVNFTMEQVIADVQANKQIMLELVGYMWFHQPAYKYKVVAQGTDMSGATTDPGLVNYFDYISIVSLYVDFTTINWGSINIGTVNMKYGDTDITTPNLPTVWNNGNDPAQLLVSATKAVLWENDEFHPDKYIEDFDCHLDRKDPDTGAILEEGTVVFKADQPPILIVRDDAGATGYENCPVLLPSCEPQQIDFSIHPPIGTKAGTYKGTITLYIEHYDDTNCPTPP
jgi:hypothetical protein